MAEHGLEAAIWVVRNREAAHYLLNALHEPPSGSRRIEKTYGENVSPREFIIDAPGLTDVLTRQMIQADLQAKSE